MSRLSKSEFSVNSDSVVMLLDVAWQYGMAANGSASENIRSAVISNDGRNFCLPLLS